MRGCVQALAGSEPASCSDDQKKPEQANLLRPNEEAIPEESGRLVLQQPLCVQATPAGRHQTRTQGEHAEQRQMVLATPSSFGCLLHEDQPPRPDR